MYTYTYIHVYIQISPSKSPPPQRDLSPPRQRNLYLFCSADAAKAAQSCQTFGIPQPRQDRLHGGGGHCPLGLGQRHRRVATMPGHRCTSHRKKPGTPMTGGGAPWKTTSQWGGVSNTARRKHCGCSANNGLNAHTSTWYNGWKTSDTKSRDLHSMYHFLSKKLASFVC